MDEEMEKEDFSIAFWEWFDSLARVEKERFWNYGADMAKIYFYNKYWVKRSRSSTGQS